MKKYNSFGIAVIYVMLLLTIGCSTQKNTFVSRNFHSITTRYNGYFNARESYREGLKKLEQAHVDNYEDVLSVFRYGSMQQASLVASNMDVAYQKASTAIRKHSMNIKGVEHNRWIDDSYYLIARSHYFKGDINLSILTFQYIIRQFETPLKYKSKVWVAKAQIKGGQYSQALQTLERISKDIEEELLDQETILLYNMVYADLYLQQDMYANAIPYLEKASEEADTRTLRTRLTYLLAQVYQKENNYAQAQQAYRKVLNLSPDFQMAFQARINMAMAFDVRSGDSNFILSELQDMLKDNKNRDFRDQIYYALAQLSMKQNDVDKAMEYYRLSLENFRGNRSQKGLAFLRLGEIYFSNNELIKASQMYDSTMVYLSPEYPQYKDAGTRNTILQELAVNLTRIEREDSLQRLAALSPNERNRVIDEIMAQIEEQKRIERELEQERALMRQQMVRSGRVDNNTQSEGGWYFYNPSAVSFGQNEFYAKWGERELNDLWRISNKRVMAFGALDETVEGDSLAGEGGGGTSRDGLLLNIPTTPEKMQASNQRLAQAYYNTALIFKDKLGDNSQALKYHELLHNRFPENENKLLNTYFLYSLYNQAGNASKAETYKNIIINQFPETDIAMILSDPQYREKIALREERIQQVYSNAYNAFVAGDYSLADIYIEQGLADTTEVSREQAAQFSYLQALVFARTDSTQALVQQLNYIIENYKETKVHEPATNLLAFLGNDTGAVGNGGGIRAPGNGTTPQNQALSPGAAVFSYNPSAVHFFVMVVNTREVQVRLLRHAVNTFNKEKYADANLNISTLFFDQNRQLITVTNFADAETALAYGKEVLAAVRTNDFNHEAYTPLLVSVDNYPVFYQEKKFDEYLEFFKFYYRGLE